MTQIKKNNKNGDGRNGVVKRIIIKDIRVIKADIPLPSNINLAPLLSKKELIKGNIIAEKLIVTMIK